MARDTQSSPANEKKLEQYGVWVKVKPREVIPAPATEDSFELSDLESTRPSVTTASPAPDESALTAEEEKLLDELETELSPEEGTSDVLVPEEEPLLDDEGELPDIESMEGDEKVEDTGISELDEEELPELEEELVPAPRAEAQKKPALAPDSGEVEVTLTENGIDKDQFDDLEALESELASVTSGTRAASTTSSAEILARIEEELRSIRTDLTQLRGELSGLRKSASAPAAETPATGADTQSGFFDEDEDETIALTGDELDNILNTADIMEEVAEAPRVDSAEEEQPAAQEAAPLEDILSYETPVLEEDKISPVEDRDAALEETLSEDSLVFSDADAKDTDTTTLEELPSEMVLEDLSPSDSSQQAGEVNLDELPELDLEGIPEIESETPSPDSATVMTPAGQEEDVSDASDETIDLETLDLGEEPTVIEAVPAQPDDIEEIPEAEAVEDEKAPGATDSLAEEVDLEALTAEANELDGSAPATPTEDLEISELESIDEELPASANAEKEIEIDFESEAEPVVEPALEELAPAEPESAELESAEQILDAEEVSEESPARAAGSGTAVPENLKDEIRTVLKYMDNLLEALPDEKIQEFASSDYFVMYKKLFEDLGLGE